jgi:hypothetical protein
MAQIRGTGLGGRKEHHVAAAGMQPPDQGAFPEQQEEVPFCSVKPHGTEVSAAECFFELVGDGARQRGIPSDWHG